MPVILSIIGILLVCSGRACLLVRRKGARQVGESYTLQDLRDRLWDICDNRKEDAEQERNDIINSGWLQDHIGILINHFFSLMQVEVDRFQDTMRLLSDYYNGMAGKMPIETNHEFVRISLLDIVNRDQPVDPEKPKRVPLVSRRPQSPELIPNKQKSRAHLAKTKDEPTSESPVMVFESDEKLILDTYQYAVTLISDMLAGEVQLKEAEEEKERQQMEIKEKERLKVSKTASRASGKDAKKKSKSPNKKKDRTPEPSAPVATPEESAANQKKQELQNRIQQEYIAALEFEVAATKSRLELIKSKALAVQQELVAKVQDASKDMEKSLGVRYLAEMASIDQLTQIARHHVETATKIKYELVLDKTDFYINKDVKVVPDPDPTPCPPLVETPLIDTLTITQLNCLYLQFMAVSPTGFLPAKMFCDNLLDLLSFDLGNDILPDTWRRITSSDVKDLATAFTLHADIIDWRKFLLSAMQTWPYPSLEQLLQTLENFKAIDHAGEGTVTEEEYNQVELWFSTKIDEPASEEECKPAPFNRLENCKKFFFTLFEDQRNSPPRLNYTEMLLYFACHADPVEGFYRAFSVVTGKPIIKKKKRADLVKSISLIDQLHPAKEERRRSKDVTLSTYKILISLSDLFTVFSLGVSDKGDNYRYFLEQNKDATFFKRFPQIFIELGSENMEPIPFERLICHPFIEDVIQNDNQYKLPDIEPILLKLKQAHEGDLQGSVTTKTE